MTIRTDLYVEQVAFPDYPDVEAYAVSGTAADAIGRLSGRGVGRGAATVILAMGEGRKAAAGINAYLSAE